MDKKIFAGLQNKEYVSNSPIIVLAYHNIIVARTVDDDLYSVTLNNFKKHLDIIKRYYNVINPEQLFPVGILKKPQVLITFDDGKINNFQLAFRELVKRKMSAAFFISTKLMNTKDYMTWDNIVTMHKAGMHIGSHGHGHKNFGIIDKEETAFELSESKRILEDRLQTAIFSFAYPYGNSCNIKEEDKDILARLDYKLAFTFGGGAWKKLKDCYRIPRFMVVDVLDTTLRSQLQEAFSSAL